LASSPGSLSIRADVRLRKNKPNVPAYLPALPPEELPNYLPDVWKRHLMAEQRAKLSAHHAALVRAIIR
jgi:hypothetical protein